MKAMLMLTREVPLFTYMDNDKGCFLIADKCPHVGSFVVNYDLIYNRYGKCFKAEALSVVYLKEVKYKRTSGERHKIFQNPERRNMHPAQFNEDKIQFDGYTKSKESRETISRFDSI